MSSVKQRQLSKLSDQLHTYQILYDRQKAINEVYKKVFMEYGAVFKDVLSYGLVALSERKDVVRVTHTTLEFVAKNRRPRPHNVTTFVNISDNVSCEALVRAIVPRIIASFDADEHAPVDVQTDLVRIEGDDAEKVDAVYDALPESLQRIAFTAVSKKPVACSSSGTC